MGKQIRVSERTHRLLEALAKRHDQSLSQTTSNALAFFHSVVEQLEQHNGTKLVIRRPNEIDEVVWLPGLLHRTTKAGTGTDDDVTPASRPNDSLHEP